METRIIFEKTPRPGTYQEEKVRLILRADSFYKCQLFHLHNPRQEHYIWAISDTEHLKLKTLFDYDYIPENPNNFIIQIVRPNTYFFHQNKLYYIFKKENGYLEVGEIAIYNTWEEVSTIAEAIGMSDAHLQIAKVYHLNDNRQNARRLIGYCWRATTEKITATLPLFQEDFAKIRQYLFEDLDFEWLEQGDKIIHDKQVWQICLDEQEHFFIVPFVHFIK